MEYYVHPSSIVDTVSIGSGTTIWAFVHVLKNVTIGANCNICDHCFIEHGVSIGSNVTIKCGVYLWDGITIQDNVFIGPNVVFTNDLQPRSGNKNFSLTPTIIDQGASLGANSTILAGVTIGKFSLIGIGSVVTRDVKDYALVYGNPARQYGWVNESGEKLKTTKPGIWFDSTNNLYIEDKKGGLIKKIS